MGRDEIRNRIALLLADILDQDDVTLADDTVAADVAGWDSLAHMKLLVALEGEWNIGFRVSELSTDNVGQLVSLVQSKLAA